MRSQTKTAMVVVCAALILSGAICIIPSDETIRCADAATNSITVNVGNSVTKTYTTSIVVGTGLVFEERGNMFICSDSGTATGSFSYSGDTLTFTYSITRTYSSLGNYSFTVKCTAFCAPLNKPMGVTDTINVKVQDYFTAHLHYNANGGSGAPSTEYSYVLLSKPPSGSKTFTVSSQIPVRDGYTFLGWSTSKTASSASHTSGSSISVAYGSSTTLYAVWKSASISVSGMPGTTTLVGASYTYTPSVSVSDCTLSVSGAEWLSVSGGNITGTPSTAGTYNIKVTAARSGYTSGSQSFSIVVFNTLTFTSSPTNGVIAYSV